MIDKQRKKPVCLTIFRKDAKLENKTVSTTGITQTDKK
jgi:hypothetical protein